MTASAHLWLLGNKPSASSTGNGWRCSVQADDTLPAARYASLESFDDLRRWGVPTYG